jgi:hypothetical protein
MSLIVDEFDSRDVPSDSSFLTDKETSFHISERNTSKKMKFSSLVFQSVFLILSQRSRLGSRLNKTMRHTLMESGQSHYFRNPYRFQQVKEPNLALNTHKSALFRKFSSQKTPGSLALDVRMSS